MIEFVTQLPVVGQVGLLIGASFLLVKATDVTIGALNRLSRILKVGAFGLTAFLLALATSLPELFVSLAAAFAGTPNLALGVVIGSNIADLSLVIGGAALVGKTIPVIGDFLKRDLFYTFLAGALPLLLLLDKHLGIGDGVVLLLVYGFYNYTALRGKPKIAKLAEEEESFAYRLWRRINHRPTEKQVVWLVIGVALLIGSAEMVVRSAEGIALNLLIPPLLIGLILVAVGTSLPELSFEIQAVRKHKVAMVFGNLLGSVVANSTLILGLTAIISPIKLDGGFQSYLVATLAFLVVFNLFWFFVRTKKKLEWWEGMVLLLVYLVFIAFEFWQTRDGSF